MVTQEFDINIIPHGLPPRVEVDQYDTGLRTLIAHIYQDDTPLVMTDEYTYTVIGTKPSGTGFSYPATAENGAIVIDVTGQMTVVSGLVECGIIVWSGTDRVGTHRFNLWVQPSALQAETIIDSNDFDSIIENAIQNALADAVNKTLPIDTASGAIASFTDGADNALVEDLTVSIVPKQAGSGTPSPSNVRAISGFTKATIKRAGKNILQLPYGTSATVAGITWTVNEDGTVTADGTATAQSTLIYEHRTRGFVPPSGTYELTGNPSGGGPNTYTTWFGQWNNGSWVSTGRDNGSGATITFTDANKNFPFHLTLNIGAGQAVNNMVFKPMLRPSTITDSTYEPYTADTYEVSFGSAGTVYGGTLDVTTGVLTVDRKAVLINSLTWTAGTASGRTYFRSNVADKVWIGSGQGYPLVSSNIEYGGNYTVANMPNPSICQAPNSNELRIYDSTISTVSDMLSKYGTGQVCYYLATPIEYNLTPTEVRTLLGANNIWSDTGDTTVEYRADTGLYIDKKIAEVQALVLES